MFPALHAETGRVTTGYRTLFSILSIAFAAGVAYAAFATNSDVKAAVSEHAHDLTPHNGTIKVLSEKITETAGVAKEAHRVAGDAKEETRYIRGRIDFLVENEMEQARGSTSKLQRARRAASRVRKQSGAAEGSAEDPLSGVEGL